jgi:hypothetical protein
MKCAGECGLDTKSGLSLDVSTRWNSTYLMLRDVALCQTQHKGDTLISDMESKRVTNLISVTWVSSTHRCVFLAQAHLN